MDAAVCQIPAKDEPTYRYRPRDPSQTLLYQTIQEHLETFLTTLETDSTAKGMPDYVKEEFREFLKCGVLAHGFLRYRCGTCEHELLVGFSCKRRGFCPSCLGRRMAEVAAHLTDNVIPDENVRQWVATFPFPMRYWCASSKELTAKINTIVVREIARFYKMKAAAASGYPRSKLHPGIITFVQRFGSSLNVHLHLHLMALDGVYLDRTERGLPPKFIKVTPPSDDEVCEALARIARKAIKKLRKMNYLQAAVEEESVLTGLDPYLDAEPEHSRAMSASVMHRIAFGPRQGQQVRTVRHLIHRAFGYDEDLAQTLKSRCATVNGFSLHADVRVKKGRRQDLERLLRYMARGPFSHKRLSQNQNGDLRYELKTPWHNGTVAITLSPKELLEKLAALIPIPRFNLFRYAGIFAPHHKLRPKVTPKQEAANPDPQGKLPKAFRLKWQQLLKRIFSIDIASCPWCHKTTMKFVSVISDPPVLAKFLTHLDKPPRPPPITPPQLISDWSDW